MSPKPDGVGWQAGLRKESLLKSPQVVCWQNFSLFRGSQSLFIKTIRGDLFYSKSTGLNINIL